MEEKLKSNIISSELALNLRFALGNTYENHGNFKKSFKHYEEGNKSKIYL